MEDFESKYNGPQVEEMLDQIASGEIGGGGGVTVETDPVFSASPAASITEAKKTEWDGKYTKPSGGIPASDLASDVFLQGEQGEQGPKGDDGVGIASVVQTTTSSADGGSNVMTVTLSDGTKSTFTVKNGSKGSQGEQGPKGDTGAEGLKGDKGDKGDTGATFTPSVDANGNLSWTNNKGLSNPPTVNIKGPKGDSGEGGGKEIVEAELDGSDMLEIDILEENKIYVVPFSIEGLHIYSVSEPTGLFAEYAVVFLAYKNVTSITLPSDWVWANGTIPTIDKGILYELSLTASRHDSEVRYRAVLTPFKKVE